MQALASNAEAAYTEMVAAMDKAVATSVTRADLAATNALPITLRLLGSADTVLQGMIDTTVPDAGRCGSRPPIATYQNSMMLLLGLLCRLWP